MTPLKVAEFFAGIGLVRSGLEQAGFRVLFANDNDRTKLEMYAANFGPDHYMLADIRQLTGLDVPTVDLATASFPCTDLSLAGLRRGLEGSQSGLFWEFARIIEEMGPRRPASLLLENVPSFATSSGGKDLRVAILELNRLGYVCDILAVDARHFVPQSRLRLFVVASQDPPARQASWHVSNTRPRWILDFVSKNRDLRIRPLWDASLPKPRASFADVVEDIPESDPRWWTKERSTAFIDSLKPLHLRRLELLRDSSRRNWATAYRRTRETKAIWEIRSDSIAGCLRTARGGSSKQAVVEGGFGKVRIRWLTPREAARLQGAPEFTIPAALSESQALFGFGDAVCVPAIAWLGQNFLRPLLSDSVPAERPITAAYALDLPLSFNAI